VTSGSGALLTIGELTLDDVVIEGGAVDWQQAGGGALYSAVGALVWSPDVGVSSAVGHDYPQRLLDELGCSGLDLRGVVRSAETQSIGLWLLYESDGTRRQVQKSRGGTFAALDDLRRPPSEVGLTPAGAHVAPQSSEGQLRALEQLRGRDVVRTLDLLIEPYIDRGPYTSGAVFAELDAFLPSAQEVVDIWGHDDTRRLGQWLVERGSPAGLAVKRGSDGVDVLAGRSLVRVPSVVEHLVDPTGAGDAFCGGFLAGLVATGDPVEAAVRGVVSASFVCETRGALAAIARIDPDIARRRAARARRALREVS
jgi:cytidine kinase